MTVILRYLNKIGSIQAYYVKVIEVRPKQAHRITFWQYMIRDPLTQA